MSVWKKLFGRSGSVVRSSARRSPLGFEALEDRRVLSAVVPTITVFRSLVAIVASPPPAAVVADARGRELSPAANPNSPAAEDGVAGKVSSSTRADGKAADGVLVKFASINEEIVAKTVGNPEDGTDDRKPPVPPDNPRPQPHDGGDPLIPLVRPAASRTIPGADHNRTAALGPADEPHTVEDIVNGIGEPFNATDVTDIIASQMPAYGKMDVGEDAAKNICVEKFKGWGNDAIEGPIGKGLGKTVGDAACGWLVETVFEDAPPAPQQDDWGNTTYEDWAETWDYGPEYGEDGQSIDEDPGGSVDEGTEGWGSGESGDDNSADEDVGQCEDESEDEGEEEGESDDDDDDPEESSNETDEGYPSPDDDDGGGPGGSLYVAVAAGTLNAITAGNVPGPGGGSVGDMLSGVGLKSAPEKAIH